MSCTFSLPPGPHARPELFPHCSRGCSGKSCRNVGPCPDNGCVVAETARDAPVGQAVQVTLLGQVSIAARGRVVSEWPRPSARRLCARVLVSPGRRVSRDLACDQLFPRLEPRAAARALSKALSMARSALAELGPDGTALLSADLLHIWASPRVARSSGQLGDDALSAALAEDGELLADEPYAEWAIRVRERYETLRQEARLALARDRAAGAGRGGRG